MNGTRVTEASSFCSGARAAAGALRLALLLALALAAGCATSIVDRERDGGGTARDASVWEPADAGPSQDAAPTHDAGPSQDAAPSPPDAGPPPMACPRVRVVTPGEVLNIRPSPSTSMPVIGTLPDGAIVEVVSMARGESIGGVDLWFEIRSSAGNGFVFSTFARCTTDEPPADRGYFVPFACGARVRVSQAPGGRVSHTGRSMYAYDFAVALNTEIRAMRGGRVTYVFTGTRPGDPCYGGGGPSCGPAANLVIIQHSDGTTAAYKHINSATVSVGAVVRQGDLIARSGTTGYSTGPHLHAEVRSGCPTTVYCDTIRFTFADVGTPSAGTTVTSGNCP